MANTLTFEAFESEWLTEILADNPNTLEKGRRFSGKLIGQWLDFDNEKMNHQTILFFVMGE